MTRQSESAFPEPTALTNPFGATTRTLLTKPLSFSSRKIRPASIVLPSPTSSASRSERGHRSRHARGMELVRQRNYACLEWCEQYILRQRVGNLRSGNGVQDTVQTRLIVSLPAESDSAGTRSIAPTEAPTLGTQSVPTRFQHPRCEPILYELN